jgi:hypothetical protein
MCKGMIIKIYFSFDLYYQKILVLPLYYTQQALRQMYVVSSVACLNVRTGIICMSRGSARSKPTIPQAMLSAA